MEELTYLQLHNHNEDHRVLLESLTIPYNRELDAGGVEQLSTAEIRLITRDMLAALGSPGVHLELCYRAGELVGFWYGKVENTAIDSSTSPECATILEFYVRPRYRRQGIGRAMYRRAAKCLRAEGAMTIILTADPVMGRPFWATLGFSPTGNRSEDNGLALWSREIAGD